MAEENNTVTPPDNPTVSFSWDQRELSDPVTEREFWSKEAFFDYKPFLVGTWDDVRLADEAELNSFKYDKVTYFWRYGGYLDNGGDVLNTQPTYVADSAWDKVVRQNGSAFINGKHAIMPKLIFPSTLYVANGINGFPAMSFKEGSGQVSFDWDIEGTDVTELATRSGNPPNYVVSIIKKYLN